ncbi:hypothetical protein [uncultured Bacteroides sp.]|uniref:hypothetical protein n=1 Tax=uncultured Bacteroides sp. TaxID=162156 RepID=UPI0025FA2D38|nr:hypothetical protein [uncultured Bacteroides sp.]
MKAVTNFFLVLLMLPLLAAGCRSSRSGSSHADASIQYLKETNSNSIDIRNRLTRKLAEQDARLRVRVIEYYPPEPADTTGHGPVKSVADLDFSVAAKAASTVEESRIACSSDTVSEHLAEKKTEDATYQIKHLPWYRPFIPYLVFALVAAGICYFRRK